MILHDNDTRMTLFLHLSFLTWTLHCLSFDLGNLITPFDIFILFSLNLRGSIMLVMYFLWCILYLFTYLLPTNNVT